MRTFWIYENGDDEKWFESRAEALAWLRQNDRVGFVKEYEVGPQRPTGTADLHDVPRAQE